MSTPTDKSPNSKPLSNEDILSFDKQHIWHPYSSFASDNPLFSVASASGAELILSDGRRLIDGMSSWWSVVHGYNHPQLNAAIKAQVDQVSHVMFGGLTHEPAVRLVEKLVRLTPKGLDKVFISDSGSVAVEVAIKMALQYWHSQGQKNKTKMLALRKGYHGDTFAAMSTCDPVTGMHQLFTGVLPEQIFTESPSCRFDEAWDERYIEDFKQKLSTHHDAIAAVILEPIVQGTGGMRFYSPHFLRRVRELCDEFNVLLIADEIATGFCRTGKFFACEFANISPDIMCVGKAMTGGYLSLAATLCTDDVAQGICRGEAGVFMHGPTFMANPLACAVANASIELLENSDWQSNILRISNRLNEGLSACAEISAVKDVRVMGAIGVVELHEDVQLKILQPRFVERGIWLRPFGKMVYTMPPYITSDQQLSTLTEVMTEVIKTI